MEMFFFVNYKEQDSQIVEIRASLVEGDHEGPDQVFTGPDAVDQLRAWATQYPDVTAYSTGNFLDAKEMEKVRKMIKEGRT